MGSLGFPGLGDSTGFNPALLESFQYNSFLLPRDGMLARYSMSSCVCPSGVRPSVCLSVINRYCIEASRQIELVFGVEVSFHLFHCVMRKFGCLQKQGYCPLKLCPKLWSLENFATVSRLCCQQNPSTVEVVDDT